MEIINSVIIKIIGTNIQIGKILLNLTQTVNMKLKINDKIIISNIAV